MWGENSNLLNMTYRVSQFILVWARASVQVLNSICTKQNGEHTLIQTSKKEKYFIL